MHSPIVNFPNVVTSLPGVIRIPVRALLGASRGESFPRSRLRGFLFAFRYRRARRERTGVSAGIACLYPRGHRESIFYIFYPRRYLSRSARKRGCSRIIHYSGSVDERSRRRSRRRRRRSDVDGFIRAGMRVALGLIGRIAIDTDVRARERGRVREASNRVRDVAWNNTRPA